MLHIEKHRKNDQLILADTMYKIYPDILFIVYNGNGLYVFPHSQRHLIIGDHYPNDLTFNFKRSITISHLLQRVKDNDIRKISVISGRMAGRGVSFVSEDFMLHITDQLYLPSSSAHDESMAQHLRILGRYRECDINLYAKKSVINKLDKNYQTRDTCNKNLETNNTVLSNSIGTVKDGRIPSLSTAINTVPLNTIYNKFSRPKVCKHIKFRTQNDNL